ncbi:hypothetical protein NDU88_004379 [Pleurodeles waltl]|uniref:Uncharacterized protein n=1 Tax=Pleurodeles waltl TaxID=8319 RepID=A0AAV7L194_PLEWA|nr:hypothetical protein NDU88_004379 [Pleurodeles waltl]
MPIQCARSQCRPHRTLHRRYSQPLRAPPLNYTPECFRVVLRLQHGAAHLRHCALVTYGAAQLRDCYCAHYV